MGDQFACSKRQQIATTKPILGFKKVGKYYLMTLRYKGFFSNNGQKKKKWRMLKQLVVNFIFGKKMKYTIKQPQSLLMMQTTLKLIYFFILELLVSSFIGLAFLSLFMVIT